MGVVMSSTSVTCLLVAFSLCAVTCADDSIENVALGKQCRMTSFHHAMPKSCQRALNNDTGGKYQNTDNCIHTIEGDPKPWFEVDLGQTYPILSMTMWARDLYEKRMANCIITVDDQECFQCPEDLESPFYKSREMKVNCTQAMEGRVVRISRRVKGSRPDGDDTINLCELQVFSCADGVWGSQCEQQCGQCEGEDCDKVTGHCTGCVSGWHPPFCTVPLPEPRGPDTSMTVRGSGGSSAAAPYLVSGALAVAASMIYLP